MTTAAIIGAMIVVAIIAFCAGLVGGGAVREIVTAAARVSVRRIDATDAAVKLDEQIERMRRAAGTDADRWRRIAGEADEQRRREVSDLQVRVRDLQNALDISERRAKP